MKKELVLKGAKVVLTIGTSKSGNEYGMLKILTGDHDLDSDLKPMFLSKLQIRVITSNLKEEKDDK